MYDDEDPEHIKSELLFSQEDVVDGQIDSNRALVRNNQFNSASENVEQLKPTVARGSTSAKQSSLTKKDAGPPNRGAGPSFRSQGARQSNIPLLESNEQGSNNDEPRPVVEPLMKEYEFMSEIQEQETKMVAQRNQNHRQRSEQEELLEKCSRKIPRMEIPLDIEAQYFHRDDENN